MIQDALHNQCVGNRSIFLSASPHLPVLYCGELGQSRVEVQLDMNSRGMKKRHYHKSFI